MCYFRSLYKDAVCGRSSILLEALTQRAKRRKNPFIIHEIEATVELKSISLTQEQSVFFYGITFLISEIRIRKAFIDSVGIS